MKNDKCGVYQILNKFNGKMYVGSSYRIYIRWLQHLSSLRRGVHENAHLQNAWNKYGKDGFEFNVLEECEKNKLKKQEQCWIDKFQCYKRNKGYNIDCTVDRKIISEETKKKLSKNHVDFKGEKHPRSKLTWEKVGEIRKKSKTNNFTNKELSKMYNISETVIDKIIQNKNWIDKDYVYVKKPSRSGERCNFAKLTWELVKQLRKEYQLGIPPRELIKKYNITKYSIYLIMKNKNWHDPDFVLKKNKFPKYGKKVNIEIAREIRRLYKTEKYTQPQLAEMFKISSSIIHRIIINKAWKEAEE